MHDPRVASRRTGEGRLKRLAGFHPFLVAVFPVLTLAADNAANVPLTQVWKTAAVCLAGAALLWAALRPLLGGWPKAAAMTSLLLVVFFSYGHLHGLNDRFPLFRSRFLMPAAAVVVAAGFWALRRARRDPSRLAEGIALVAGVLVLGSLARMAWQRTRSATAPTEAPRGAQSAPAKTGARPDVYYVILDGYGSAETLRAVYGFDNRPFLEALRARGFYVAGESRSNYAQTPLSLASSTNMEYVPPELEASGRKTKDIVALFRMIEESRVMAAFRARGYRTVHFQSGWAVTARNRYADRNVNCGGWEEFNRVLAQTTLLEAANFFQPIEKQSRERILCEFDRLAAIAREVPGPRYVFAHFVFPEPPFLFDRDGRPRPGANVDDPSRQSGDRAGYVDQIVFCNRKVLAAIDRILADSPTPPIIVVQGDHGPASKAWRWMYSDEGPPATGREPGIAPFFRERFGILNAYRVPPEAAARLYPSISPVNSFRVVLDACFGENLPLLADRSWFSRYAHPFWFVDVTATVAPAAPVSGASGPR
jgi:hypothetical protein